MTGNRAFVAIGLLVAGLSVLPAARAEERQAPTLVVVQAGIEVDAGGRVVGVELDPDARLPDVLRERTEQAVAEWRFKPIVENGEAVGGKTWAHVQICLAASTEGRLNVAVSKGINGPGNVSGQWVPNPPFNLMRTAKSGVEYDFLVRYRVEPDGSAELLEAHLVDPELEDRYGSGWRRDVRRDIARARFKPEIIDGRPVSTVMELPITIVRSPSRAVTRDAIRESQGNAPVCQAAAGKAKNEAVAIDSRFELAPQG
ncbi:hypothetical protein [Marilutibacter spongiae]|uniref:TonB C-terminal domain-containing protein n=1 Tax=Marilutibacter spongiae TaxID=2025720 RepID=A0A7W3TKA7_9GAMM|nr:hypothetical protein [Lysobacter spongiae]MBB1059858.1 hypothetical protein [Lysobacter spongiae]